MGSIFAIIFGWPDGVAWIRDRCDTSDTYKVAHSRNKVRSTRVQSSAGHDCPYFFCTFNNKLFLYGCVSHSSLLTYCNAGFTKILRLMGSPCINWSFRVHSMGVAAGYLRLRKYSSWNRVVTAPLGHNPRIGNE